MPDLRSNYFCDAAKVVQSASGTVYSAISKKTKGLYGVRTVSLEAVLARDWKDSLARFVAASKVRDVHLLPYDDIFFEPEHRRILIATPPYFETLYSMIATGNRLSEPEIWHYIEEITAGLKVLYSEGLVHGNLMPESVVCHNGQVYLADYGDDLPCESRHPRFRCDGRDIRRSTLYKAPELLRGSPRTVASDVWALGCLIAEVCGFFLLSTVNLASNANGVTLPGYSKELTAFVRNCLHKDPSMRLLSGVPVREFLPKPMLEEAVASRKIEQIKKHIHELQPYNASCIMVSAMKRVPEALGILCEEIAEKKLYVTIGTTVVATKTDLMKAASVGSVPHVKKFLYQMGCQYKPWGYGTALMFAAKNGHFDCVKLLLCEVGISFTGGTTALMMAAQYGHANCVRLLVEFLAGVQKANGWTALMSAIRHSHYSCAKLLYHQERYLVMTDGLSASDLARAYGQRNMMELLSCAD